MVRLASDLLFYLRGMKYSVGDIAALVGGTVDGDASALISGPAKIEDALPTTITFLGNLKYESHIYTTGATAILVGSDFQPSQPLQATLIVVDNVYQALSKLLLHFDQAEHLEAEIASTAIVHETASIGSGVSIGHHVVIGPNAVIGNYCKIYHQVYIGDGVTIGSHTTLHVGVRLMRGTMIGSRCVLHPQVVVGSDGFGFAKDAQGQHEKVSQIGNVLIGNDVEIGANTVIDRATMGSTVIEHGVKLDNLIQVAHNARIGADTVIAAQTGVSGSTTIGKRCMIGGQVGFVGHLDIADGTMIQAQSGIASSIKEPGQRLYGYPAIGYQGYLRSYAYFKQLPDLAGKLRKLQQELDQLKKK